MRNRALWLALTCVFGWVSEGALCATAAADEKGSPMIHPDFFKDCAFVSVDIQEGAPPKPLTYDEVPKLWKSMGFTVEDVNAANDFGWNVALPNAVKVAEACRKRGLPMVFIHWGHLFEDAMDLDPEVRDMMIKEHGDNPAAWGPRANDPAAQPAKAFSVRPGEYVLAKTAQDAFRSCNLEFVLRNLKVRNQVFVGGHTEACLGKTAKSAKRLGFRTLCVEDATSNARESTRRKGIEESGFDYVVTTEQFLNAVESVP